MGTALGIVLMIFGFLGSCVAPIVNQSRNQPQFYAMGYVSGSNLSDMRSN